MFIYAYIKLTYMKIAGVFIVLASVAKKPILTRHLIAISQFA